MRLETHNTNSTIMHTILISVAEHTMRAREQAQTLRFLGLPLLLYCRFAISRPAVQSSQLRTPCFGATQQCMQHRLTHLPQEIPRATNRVLELPSVFHIITHTLWQNKPCGTPAAITHCNDRYFVAENFVLIKKKQDSNQGTR